MAQGDPEGRVEGDQEEKQDGNPERGEEGNREESLDEVDKNRGTWGNSIEFLMSCIAMNVGLGNIWRFPFVAYENGGGAFLIPYILVLLLLGRPVYYLEMCLGQFSSRGNVKMFESLAQVLKGVGFGQLIGTFSVATYYCSLMALTLYYLVHSFTDDLPWSKCNPRWADNEWMGNATCVPSKSTNVGHVNNSISSAEAWFRIEVLREKGDISGGIGVPNWELTICLLCAWAITFGICAKGVQSSGKASYFLAIFPYVILFALLGRSATLEGAGQGILYFISPDWGKLLSAKVWYSAVTQCFFSLNIGFGSVTMYASFNNFEHNVYRDALVVTTLDTFTSVLSGFIIFGILGNLAFKMNVDVPDVVKSGGTGLAFISYPEAIARFEAVPWLFAILFFFMLFVLGVGSLIALKACAFGVILDAFPHLKTWHVSLCTAVVGFLVGLVYITPGGQYIFTMVDFFGGTFIFYVLTIIEIVAVIWWYGLSNICLDIEFMLKRKTGPYWRICWAVIIPIGLISVFFYFVITLEELTYEGQTYPFHAIVWGWALFGVGVLQPVIWWAVEIFKNFRKETIAKAILSTFKHDSWGPKDPAKHAEWVDFKTGHKQKFTQNQNWFKKKLYLLVAK